MSAARLKYRSGGVTVEIDDIGEELTRRAIERVAPGLQQRIRDAVEGVRRNAESEWPVGRTDLRYLARHPEKRGRPHSRDQFESEVAIERTGFSSYEITGRITNRAEYWRFIRPNKLRGGSALVVYIRKPLERERDRIRDELPYLLPEGLRG